ncbi:class I SAM-dependent methyltransferase [Candidatus Dojkabacteria bacterium]|uniref:Class I SAM-dependent methyltransferase n=1 Tax=Candidatus Dojkabacteria bacterium TaxID=2099670 RepID=A0A955I9J1_9BACT|nr:class I SAM-dependent methyltransferase [Candidatus Dojkabacteria bacterium]
MNKNWKFYNPLFEYKQGLDDVMKSWDGGNFFEYNWDLYPSVFDYKEGFEDYNLPWTGHSFFSYDLVRNIQPKVIAELGTFKGTSLYTFAQAAKDSAIDTKIFAIDSWEGEEQTGEYGEEIYDFVRKMVRKHYPEQEIRLMKMYFNEALKEFEDGSIDILHIDGLHTYEAVKDDYDSWKEKVSNDGIIFFHDVNVSDFGVWKVFEEAAKEYSDGISFKFKHNYGLGVIIKNKETIPELQDMKFRDLFVEVYKFIALGVLKAEENSVLRKELNSLQEKVDKQEKHIDFLNKSLDRKSIKLIKKIFP